MNDAVYFYPPSCRQLPDSCFVLAEQDRTVLFWGALNVRLSWDAMLIRWSVMLVMACCGVYAEIFKHETEAYRSWC